VSWLVAVSITETVPEVSLLRRSGLAVGGDAMPLGYGPTGSGPGNACWWRCDHPQTFPRAAGSVK